MKNPLQEIAMPEAATAEIIPFPARPAAPTTADRVASPPIAPSAAEVRLARALAGLNQAVAEQRVAMAAWKAAIGDLKTVTRRLGNSLRTYNDSLGQLDTRVSSLRTQAVKLEAWADDVLAKKG
jgi:hypothetical protein